MRRFLSPLLRIATLKPLQWRLCLVFLGLASTATAQIPNTQLTTIFPPGGKLGATVEVRVAGGDQDEVNQLIFSHPGLKAVGKMTAATEFEKARPQPGVFDVQIAGDVPVGIYEARVIGRFGISNPRAFVVGFCNEANDPGGNTQPTTALAATLDTTLNGIVDGNQVDYFKLPLKAGQRVIIDCQATRIDSRLDATLVVYNAAGKELARERNTWGSDPLIDFTAPVEGEYRVALHDFTYRGGAEYFYRLTPHFGPHVDFVFPPAGLPGSNEQYFVYGRNLPGGYPADGLTIGGIPLQKMPINLALPADEPVRLGLEVGGWVSSSGALLDGIAFRNGSSIPVTLCFAKAPVVRETEPNNQPSQSQPVAFPCEINGQFYPARDLDYFVWQGKKGELYDIQVFSHQLGLQTDALLTVQKVKKNEKGEEVIQELAQVDDPGDRNNRIGSEFDTSTDDPAYSFTADEDATYRVSVHDQFGDSRSDPRMVYRLLIHKGEPDFRLVAIPQPVVAPANDNNIPLGGASVRKGGTTPIEVRLDRRHGFTGDVEISVEGLPAGVTCPVVVLGATSNTGSLILSAADNAAAWAGTIRVVGKSKFNDKDIVRYARSGIAVWGSPNKQQEQVTFRLTRDLAFAVIDRELLPAQVAVVEDKIWETSRGGKLEIPIHVTRRAEFKEDLNLAPLNVINEMKPPNLTIKGAEADGKLQFAATNNNLKAGVYTFYLRADTKLKHQRNPELVVAAEQEQKDIDAMVAMLTEKNKLATDAKNNATKVATDAAALVKQLEQAKTAAETEAKQAAEKATQAATAANVAKEAAAKDANNAALKDAATAAETAKTTADAAKTAADAKLADAQKKLVDGQAAAKTADDAKVAAEKAATDADAKVKGAQAAKANIDKRLNDAKAANAPKDLQFAVVSTPVKVRVVETCLQLTATNPPAALKQGEKLELPLKIGRLFGFDDQVEISLELPNGVQGIAANKVTIAKGQADGKFEITAAKDAKPGDYAVIARAKARFNNIEVQASQPIVIKIEAVAK